MSHPHSFDIREYKKGLRKGYRALRERMPEALKQEKNGQICRLLCQTKEYRRCKLLLIYVSTEIEVDTHEIIRRALSEGKTVAVPYCVNGTRKMYFYQIHSLEELVPRTFGVLEPVAEHSRRITDFSGALCVLPGLAFDRYGYRLGYGGGYYDRFLSHVYRGPKVGICYYACTRPALVHGRYDVPCDLLVTENGVVRAKHKKRGKSAAK